MTVTGAVARVAGEKVTVTPDGAPLAERATAEVNPPCLVRVRLTVPDFVCATVRLEGFATNAS